MSDFRAAIEHEIEGVQPRPYTYEGFQERRLRTVRRDRIVASALGLVVGVVLIVSVLLAFRGREDVTPATPSISPANISALRLDWSRDTGASIDSSPVVVDDRVYVTNTAGSVLAFPTSCADASATCRPIWTANQGPDTTFGLGSPAVGEGMVFAGSLQGEVFGYPISCAPGRCRPTWVARPGGDLSAAAPVVDGGVVYVGSSNGSLYAYGTGCTSYPRPCAPLWTAELQGGFGAGGNAGAEPVVAGGVVYVGSSSGTLYSFPTSCRGRCHPLRQVHLPGGLRNPLVLVDGTLYVTAGSDLVAYPTRCLDRGMRCGPDWVGTTTSDILSPPVVGNGNVYVGSTDGAVRVFPEACGQGGRSCPPAWSIPDLGRYPNPSLVDGVLFVGSSWATRQLLAFDANCGAAGVECVPAWTFTFADLGAAVQPTASDGAALFATTGDLGGADLSGAGGGLYAFRVPDDVASGRGASAAGPGGRPMDIVTLVVLAIVVATVVALWRRRAR